MSDVSITWDAVTLDVDGQPVAITAYRIFKDSAAVPFAAVAGGVLQHTDPNVSPGPHTYTVLANSATGGDGAQSAPAAVLVPGSGVPLPPANVTATVV